MNKNPSLSCNLVLVEAQHGEIPAARFGHTITYLKNYTAVLFGGAINDSGSYNITNETYSLNMLTFEWNRIISNGTPTARAAHGAACVDPMQLVVYGGAAGNGSLSTDELYLLDLKKEAPLSWMSVPITGVTPGRRYGHSLICHKPIDSSQNEYLIVYGGNDGLHTLCDVWVMDILNTPFSWINIEIPNTIEQPEARVYTSASICQFGPATGMMVIFGGRKTNSVSANDTWGLRQHRDKRWDWIKAPSKNTVIPDPRFQHTCVFIGSKFFVIGGRTGEITKALPTNVYDTEDCCWQISARIVGGEFCSVYLWGFNHRSQSQPTADMFALDVRDLFGDPSTFENKMKLFTEPLMQQDIPIPKFKSLLRVSVLHPKPCAKMPQAISLKNVQSDVQPGFSTASLTHIAKRVEVRLASHVHTKVDSPFHPDFSALVRKISIDRLEDESRKIRSFPYHSQKPRPSIDVENDFFATSIIRRLLRPNVTPHQLNKNFNCRESFCLSWAEVSTLCNNTFKLIQKDNMLLSLRSPIKVYGDVHGQYYDLMRLFGSYKCPVEEDWKDENQIPPEVEILGDLDSTDYLFLGDFVDRGTHSLEVICLLFALKCRYPSQIHLIRGNHEDRAINSIYGFQDECRRRLNEEPLLLNSCWNQFNKIFDYLPLAALIENSIICIHGGIGATINTIDDIKNLKRPITVSQTPTNETEQKVTDILWSDPTDNDSIIGVIPNYTRDQDGSGKIYKYGPDRVKSFCAENNIDLIIRAHECVMDGFERFAGGKLITLFSATDYCGHRNAGALLYIRRDLMIVPKVIYPTDRGVSVSNTWLHVDSRPPTPPRSIKRASDTDLGF